jgi:energy-coupling factor transporter ATP-binding protein EcfA2
MAVGKPARMIESLTIESFRGIEKAEISGLTSVSVLVGPNGSGKTTVMEAMHIVCQPLAGLMRALGGALRRANDSQWLTFQGRRTAALSFAANGVTVKVEVKSAESIAVFVQQNGESKYDLTLVEGHWLLKGTTTRAANQSLAGLPPVKTLGPFESTSLEDRFSEASKLGFRGDLRRLAQDLLAPANDLEILLENHKPLLHVVYPGHSVPIDLVGEGVRTAVEIMCALAAPPSSLVLLEEPERHQHPRSLGLSCRAVWKAVAAGHQVVISTHSLEWIDYLLATAESQLEALSLFRLQLQNGVCNSVRVAGEELKEARHLVEDELR